MNNDFLCNVTFSYCPLVWMFHDRKSYNKINKIHERALRIIHKNSTSNFKGLIIKGNSVSVHQINLQLLLIEIYRTISNLNPPFMAKVFLTNVVPYNLRGSTNLVLPKARTNLYGIDAARFDGQKLYGRVCRKKSKSPKYYKFSKEILRPCLVIAALNYADVIF